jgi:heme/copper-type cytochrome/quinol oxidase subunit 4
MWYYADIGALTWRVPNDWTGSCRGPHSDIVLGRQHVVALGAGLPGLTVLAIAPTGVHIVLFLHITAGADSFNNIRAPALGILIVVLMAAGSIFIGANINEAMMPRSS